MARITASTNDPLFWMHHSFVDHIWESWRKNHQTREQRETQFPYDEPTCSSQAHFMNSTMVPWSGMRIIDGLSNNYTSKWEVKESPPVLLIHAKARVKFFRVPVRVRSATNMQLRKTRSM
ncbi:hypothetical protein ANCDUO_01424 [Ancylostoma duodenale]|uniref:Tyrosinase copper-binding domain-containing protein n=1 Tax=Ancylostoma duodenale TaxID=51022 RepID=A0A0C2H351_9BILA|nr:hypothetical protein ANCDUO_01424 [Ancylostoma duodenale]